MKLTQDVSENEWGKNERVNSVSDMEKYVLGLEGVLEHETGQISLIEVKGISEEISRWKTILTVVKRLKN